MRTGWVVGCVTLLLGGCLHQGAITASKEAGDACKAQTFRTTVEFAKCQNDAVRLARSAYAADEGQVEVALAQRVVLAERVDRGQMTRAEFDLEAARIKQGLQAMSQARQTQTAQAVTAGATQFQNTLAANAANRPLNCSSTNMGAGTVNTTCY